MDKDLEAWFYPHANKLAQDMGQEKWKGRVPILVESCWHHQQKKLNDAMNLISKLNQEKKKLQAQLIEATNG